MSEIRITLSSAAMGDVSEADFDAWASYVTEHVNEGAGVEVSEVDQQRFGDAGEDRIEGATLAERDAIRTWLAVTGWDAFCGDESAWPKVAAE
jgi:hypothetical protein